MSSETSLNDRLSGRCEPDDGASGELMQRMLLATDGTVTTLLEVYAGEPIEAVELGQSRRPALSQDAEMLAMGEGADLLDRRVLLCGVRSGSRFVYGESLIVPERLEADILERLESTTEPIGKLLRTRRLETFREVITVGKQRAGPLGALFGSTEDAVLLFRTYRIIIGGSPAVLITEKVPANDEGGLSL